MRRKALSLLEILISILIVAVGLLGVASVLVVGGHHAAKGERTDMAWRLANSATAELRVRGWLDRRMHASWQASTNGQAVFWTPPYEDGFVIDPLFVVSMPAATPTMNPWMFPSVPPATNLEVRLHRLTTGQIVAVGWDGVLGTADDNAAMFLGAGPDGRYGTADDVPDDCFAIQSSPDELAVFRPTDTYSPPQRVGNGRWETEGRLTWFATMVPTLPKVVPSGPMDFDPSWTLSVVVVNRRDFTEVERAATVVNRNVSSNEGPEVAVSCGTGEGPIRERQWIMLHQKIAAANNSFGYAVSQWLQVLHVDDPDAATGMQDVTLDRPWIFTSYPTTATIVRGVVAVKQSCVAMETQSMHSIR